MALAETAAPPVSITSPSARPTLANQARRAARHRRPVFRARRELDSAICAIGGITLANAPPLIAAGADLLAVITDLFGARTSPPAPPSINAFSRSNPHDFPQSATFLFARAQKHIPGGVNSPVRLPLGRRHAPVLPERAPAPRCRTPTASGTDYVGSWGPMILGHAHPEVIAAVQAAVVDGLSFGAPTEKEVEIADLLCEMVPSMDMVRLVSSGTEATMSAIRLARGYTGRDVLVKFEGCYHGHADSLLVKAGSGLLTFGNPSSGGVPAGTAETTMVLTYNDPQGLADAFAKRMATRSPPSSSNRWSAT